MCLFTATQSLLYCKNPQNGKAMTIQAKTVIKFKEGKAMGDEVNNG